MSTKNIVPNKIKEIREKKGLAPSKLAKQSNLEQQLIYNYENQKSNLSINSLVNIADVLGCSTDEILNRKSDDKSLENSNFVHIPRYNIKASAGQGTYIIDDEQKEVTGGIIFKPYLLRQITMSNPKDLIFLQVSGDSMRPTFNDGDFVMIDRAQNNISSEGVFVFNFDGLLKIKRIAVDHFNRQVIAKSDNQEEMRGEKKYPDHVITEESLTGLNVVGKVVWASVKVV